MKPVVYPNVKLGKNVKIEEFAVVGYPKTSEPTIIEDDVVIGVGSIIYSGCHIKKSARIFQNVILRERTVVGENSKIGSKVLCEGDTYIGNNVSITSQCHLTSHMIIEDHVFMGPNCTTTNTRQIVYNRPWLGKPDLKGPTIQRGARIGGQVCILPGVIIGEQALVGAGAVVTKDIPAFKIAFGVPAKVAGDVPPQEVLRDV